MMCFYLVMETASIKILLDAVSLFFSISGLKVSASESNCLFGYVKSEVQDFALSYSGFQQRWFPNEVFRSSLDLNAA